jgi:hypothetical protein
MNHHGTEIAGRVILGKEPVRTENYQEIVNSLNLTVTHPQASSVVYKLKMMIPLKILMALKSKLKKITLPLNRYQHSKQLLNPHHSLQYNLQENQTVLHHLDEQHGHLGNNELHIQAVKCHLDKRVIK